MKRGNVAIFSTDGTSVEFTFGDNGEKTTILYSSKKEALEALDDLKQKQKITPMEFERMRNQVLKKKELPLLDSSAIELEIIFIPLLSEPIHKNMESVKKPTIRICNTGVLCGYIETAERTSPTFYTQVEAILCIDIGIEKGYLLQEERDRLSEEIKNSKLPIGMEKAEKPN